MKVSRAEVQRLLALLDKVLPDGGPCGKFFVRDGYLYLFCGNGYHRVRFEVIDDREGEDGQVRQNACFF